MYEKVQNSIFKHFDFLILDTLCLMLSLWLALIIHLRLWNPWESDLYMLVAITIILSHVCFAIFGSGYKGILRRGYLEEFRRVFQHLLLVLAVLLFCIFFTKAYKNLSRMVVAYFAGFSLVFLTLERDLWKLFLQRHQKNNQRRMLLVSDERGVRRILRMISNLKSSDFVIDGLVLDEDESSFTSYPDQIWSFPVVATTDTLLGYLIGHPVDEILFCFPSRGSISPDLIEQCSLSGITVHTEMLPMTELGKDKYIEKIADIPVVTSYIRMVTPAQMMLKRLMDIVGSLVGLLITGILFLFVAPMIYFTDKGPIFFAQERVGKNGKLFKMYKFRSMYQDAEERKQELIKKYGLDPLHFKMDDDPRILGSGPDGKKHGVGYFIRKTSIDEFPQFWNVFRGEMSLVGTRPPTLDEYQQYEVHHRARLAIKPGITGLWQTSGRSDIEDFEEVVKLDVKYMQNWSIWEDIKILLKTIRVVLTGEGSK